MPVSPMPESPLTTVEKRVLAALDFGFTPVTQLSDALGWEPSTIALALMKLQRIGAVIVLDLANVGRVAARK